VVDTLIRCIESPQFMNEPQQFYNGAAPTEAMQHLPK